MNKITFGERYRTACNLRDISPCGRTAEEYLGCSKAYISKLMKENQAPSYRILIAAADMLDVSTDYLLGRVDFTNTKAPNDDDDEFIKNIRAYGESLNTDGKSILLEIANTLTAHSKTSHLY